MVTELWAEEGNSTDYPQVIFDAIKDNPAYTELLLKPDVANWVLGWYMDFLSSIWDFPVLGNVVVKIIDFLCEELQHERFQELRPSVMLTATRVSVFRIPIWLLTHMN
jgi:senataxin